MPKIVEVQIVNPSPFTRSHPGMLERVTVCDEGVDAFVTRALDGATVLVHGDPAASVKTPTAQMSRIDEGRI